MPDKPQCEVFITAAYNLVRDVAFRWGGRPPEPAQCSNPATLHVGEKGYDSNKQEGHMLMCHECYQQFLKQDDRLHTATHLPVYTEDA